MARGCISSPDNGEAHAFVVASALVTDNSHPSSSSYIVLEVMRTAYVSENVISFEINIFI
jgi:hypothetical protein